jgi:hypothetical protein
MAGDVPKFRYDVSAVHVGMDFKYGSREAVQRAVEEIKVELE